MFWVRVRAEDHYGFAVVELHGELDITGALTVRGLLATVTASETITIVDLTGLDFMDCTGLGALIRGRKHAMRAGHSLLLAAPAGSVQRVLELSETAHLFPTYASVAAAVAAEGGRSTSAPAPVLAAAGAGVARRPRPAADHVRANTAGSAPPPDYVRATRSDSASRSPVIYLRTDRIWRLITGHPASRIQQSSPPFGRLRAAASSLREDR
jgi:anti-sigma B factor antagonist